MKWSHLVLILFAALSAVSSPAQNANAWAPKIEALINATPDDVIGEWSKSHVSNIDFVNPDTGSHADPSGERLNVRFFPDGHYKLGWLLQSSLYNCTSSVFGEKTGQFEIRENKITMKDTESTLTSRDNCHRQWNYQKHPPLLQSTYEWRLGRTKYGTVLIMRGPDGKDTVYERQAGPGLLR